MRAKGAPWAVTSISTCDYLHRSTISCGGKTQPVSMCESTAVTRIHTSTILNLLTRMHTPNIGLYINEIFRLWQTQEIWEGSKKTGFQWK